MDGERNASAERRGQRCHQSGVRWQYMVCGVQVERFQKPLCERISYIEMSPLSCGFERLNVDNGSEAAVPMRKVSVCSQRRRTRPLC